MASTDGLVSLLLAALLPSCVRRGHQLTCIVFWGTFFNGLEGFSELQFDAERLRTYLPHIRSFVETGFKPPAVVCTGKIRHTGRSSQLEEFCALRDLIGAEHAGDIKLTIPAPNWYHLQYRHGQAFASDVYASDAEYFADLAAAYRKELQLLYAEGLRRVQIDDPCLSCESCFFSCLRIKELGNEKTRGLLADAVASRV